MDNVLHVNMDIIKMDKNAHQNVVMVLKPLMNNVMMVMSYLLMVVPNIVNRRTITFVKPLIINLAVSLMNSRI